MAATPIPFLEAWARTAWESRSCGVRADARAPLFGGRVRAASAGVRTAGAGVCVRREGARAEKANFS